MKRLFALLLALFMLFVLCACDENTVIDDDSISTNDTENSITETDETFVSTETDEVFSSDESSQSNVDTIDTDMLTENKNTSQSIDSTYNTEYHETPKPTEATKPVHEHSYSRATCTEPEKCSCGATNGSALGHAFNQGKCSRCGVSDPNFNTVSISKQNALKKAKSYLRVSAFSYAGLISQLEYEQFSHEDAIYAADNCGANWSEQALKKAESYLRVSAFSYSGLIGQLEYEQFSHEEAVYAADNCGANWNEQASKKAKSYLSIYSFSRQGLIDQLKYEGFTNEQAEYGATSVGL